MTVAATPHLRPLGIGKLLDQAIRLYRRNFLRFIGIIAIMQIPVVLIQLVTSLLAFGDFFNQLENFSGQPPSDPFALFTPSYFAGIGVSILLAIIGFFLIQGIATAALTRAVAGSYLGETIGVIDAYRKIGRSWLSLIGALFLAGVLSIVLLIWWLIPCVGWITGFGILIFFWMVLIPLIAPVIVLEKQAAAHSIRRSWDLARRRFWWVLGFMFVLQLFAQIIITGPAILINFVFRFVIGNPLIFSTSEAILQTVLQSLVTLVFSLIYLPLQLTAVTLMYFDLRIRTEGFDLTLLTESVSSSPVEVAEVMVQAPQPERTNFVTMTEMGYFALISIGGVILYVIIVFIVTVLGLAIFAANGTRGF